MKRTKLIDRVLPSYTKGEEIFNMVTHICGGAIGVIAFVLLPLFAGLHHNPYGIVSGIIMGISIELGDIPVLSEKVTKMLKTVYIHGLFFITIVFFQL